MSEIASFSSKLPEVTVLIPCNDITFLDACLKSISTQIYKKIAVLIVLNGKAAEKDVEVHFMCQKYSIKAEILVSEANNIVDALNFGIQKCENEFIARMDADDIMLPQRIEVQLKEIISGDFLAIGGQIDIRENDNISSHPKYPTKYSDVRHCLFRYSCLAHPTVMYRKSAVIDAGLYSNKYPLIEDWYLWFRISKKGKISNMNIKVLEYRIHDKQSTKISNVQQSLSIKQFKRDNLKENFAEIIGFKHFKTMKLYQHEINHFSNYFGLLGLLPLRRSLAAMFMSNESKHLRALFTLLAVVVDSRLVSYFLRMRFTKYVQPFLKDAKR